MKTFSAQLLLSVLALAACSGDPEPTAVEHFKPTYKEPPTCKGQARCITTIVGSGYQAEGDDKVLGWKSDLNFPQDAAVAPDGTLYYIDWNDHKIRKFEAASGITTTVVGTGKIGVKGTGEPAIDAALNHPTGITFDKGGQMFIAAWHNSMIKKVDPSKSNPPLEHVAGTGGRAFGGDGGPAAKAVMDLPSSVDFDDAGDLYISDQANQRVRKVDMKTGVISTVVGSRWVTDTGKKDGQPLRTSGVKDVPDGTLGIYVCDTINGGHMPALAAWAVDLPTPSTTTACVYDAGQADKCKKDKDNKPVPIALPAADVCGGFSGDSGPAKDAQLAEPRLQSAYPGGRIVIRKGILYIADTLNHRVRKVDLGTGVIETLAGSGTASFGGDGGDAKAAQLYGPTDVDTLKDGTLLIADTSNHCIRAVKDGKISTFAGSCGKSGFSGDGGPVGKSVMYKPYGICVGPDDAVYVADTYNQRIRVITP